METGRGLLPAGTLLGGYRIESILGRGGMGVVYLATHLRLSRPVALKVISPDLAHDDEFRERFIRESQTTAALEHPNILPIYDAGEDDGALYLAMRYVPGGDLKTALLTHGPFSPARAATIVRQIALALDSAHAHGLVHRDVKPANILLGENDRPFLSDFGIARQISSRTLTRTGIFLGSVEYCSPEQIEGFALDGRADIYSLGCVLYHCLVGQPPFTRDSEIGMIKAHLMDEIPEPSATRSDVPREFDAVIARATAKSREARYERAADFAAALAPFERAAKAPPVTPRPVEVQARRDDDKTIKRAPREVPAADETRLRPPAPAPPGSSRRSQSRRWLILPGIAVALVAVGLGLAGLIFAGSGNTPRVPPSSRSASPFFDASGYVRDSSNHGIPGVRVHAGSSSAITGPGGSFTLVHVRQGAHWTAAGDCTRSRVTGVVRTQATTLIIRPKERTKDVAPRDAFTGESVIVTLRGGHLRKATELHGFEPVWGLCAGDTIRVDPLVVDYSPKTITVGTSHLLTIRFTPIAKYHESFTRSYGLLDPYSFRSGSERPSHGHFEVHIAGNVVMYAGQTFLPTEPGPGFTQSGVVRTVAWSLDTSRTAGYGMWCGTAESKFVLLASSNGQYLITTLVGSKWHNLVQGTSPFIAIGSGRNTLVGSCRIQSSRRVALDLRVNGHTVGSAVAKKQFDLQRYGVATQPWGSPPVRVAYDDFEFQRLDAHTASSLTEADAGRSVFLSAGCTGCHTFHDAQSSGTVGPDLDTSAASMPQILSVIRTGRGAMPAFEGQLTSAQIRNVAIYVRDRRSP